MGLALSERAGRSTAGNDALLHGRSMVRESDRRACVGNIVRRTHRALVAESRGRHRLAQHLRHCGGGTVHHRAHMESVAPEMVVVPHWRSLLRGGADAQTRGM